MMIRANTCTQLLAYIDVINSSIVLVIEEMGDTRKLLNRYLYGGRPHVA